MKKAKKIVSSASFTRAPERRKKGSQPCLAALGSPFQGKGLAWTLPPSYGRRCPEGAEVGWGSGMKKSGKIVSSASFTRAPERRKKGSQPRLAALGNPFQGKGLAWTLPPSIGRRCLEGAEVGWGKRYEKERGRSSQVRHLRECRYPRHKAFPARGRWRAKRAG